MKFMIYGAYGYTGELIARQAKKEGLQPVLAGRNDAKTKVLASELGLSHRVFSLDDHDAAKEFNNIFLVINCAGPFSQTFQKMAAICLETKTHYLDITGEIDVFEAAASLDAQAKQAGIVLCPGTGFDVVPTDCLAAKLKELLPDANHLALGFAGLKSVSAGTAKTTVEGLAQGGKIRRSGRIETIDLGSKTRVIDFGRGERNAVAIPWGDVSTAYHSTGIPNIEVYTPMPRSKARSLRLLSKMRALLKLGPVQKFLQNAAGKSQGPDQSLRQKEKSYVWGEATNKKEEKVVCRFTTLNGYELTSLTPILIAREIERRPELNGFNTPSKLMGAEFIQKVKGTSNWKCEGPC